VRLVIAPQVFEAAKSGKTFARRLLDEICIGEHDMVLDTPLYQAYRDVYDDPKPGVNPVFDTLMKQTQWVARDNPAIESDPLNFAGLFVLAKISGAHAMVLQTLESGKQYEIYNGFPVYTARGLLETSEN
jgi:hypothetical protein